MFSRFHIAIRGWVNVLQRFTQRIWYPPLLGLLAALDHLILVIPNDGLLISSVLLTPRRWFVLGTSVTIGSTLGALALAVLVRAHGMPFIESNYPWLLDSEFWHLTVNFFDQYGLLAVFGVAATPLAQQPIVVLAALAHTPLQHLALVILFGRFLKFMIMSYVASHAPHYLSRMWGVQGELRDAGVEEKLD